MRGEGRGECRGDRWGDVSTPLRRGSSTYRLRGFGGEQGRERDLFGVGKHGLKWVGKYYNNYYNNSTNLYAN